MSCINCNIELTGEFCPTCGEKKDFNRITFSSLIENVFSGFVNMDKGLLFNIKNLTLHPQKTIFQYIKGKRKYVLNPISYAIITISVYLILVAFLKEDKLVETTEISKKVKSLNKFEKYGYDAGGYIFSKLKFLWLLIIIYLSLFTKLIFKRFNFFEHITINAFIVGHSTIIAFFVKIIYHDEILLFNFLVFIYMIYLVYKVFLNKKEKFFTLTMAVFSVVFAYLMFLIVPFLTMIILK
ncbi:DUF3667 domain-containing protein [Polaribacter sp. PL03]|uniref:DUF3667 domain-containing protein n=1 Tax=Polaribacter sp. PL03 TaxID=3088353 RepID=UPI0029D048B5|nr:DUF3667 domain-containing protein [Polaribacter sp. PL03]MDX6746920.1 DUF3667 domain-containing protein [Polaribacter sp. PL03]